MLPGYELETVDLSRAVEVRRVEGFLSRFGLGFEKSVDMSILLRKDGEIVGTGSYKGEVLRNIAIEESIQGEGLTATIVNALIQEQARHGILHYLIFTKPDAAPRFIDLGFREIARAAPHAVLLEGGIGSVDDYIASVAHEAGNLPPERCAVVVNCNPFTLGHRWLLEKAASESQGLIVFVVSEDLSLFPFKDRFDLVRRGLAHVKNAVVVPTGIYMVSSATFPTYFTREESLAAAQARLDISLFADRIAPRLGIKARYVGEEPYCETTEAYNQAMHDILPGAGIAHRILARHEVDGRIVSASTVRECIRNDDWKCVRTLVPDVTWDYLVSPEHADIINKIKNCVSRH